MSDKKLTLYVILVASVVNFLVAFLSSAVTVAIPIIAIDLGLSNIVQNWISNIFLLTIAVFSVPCGYIVSKYGIKKCMIIGIIISLISCLGCALSFSAESLLLFRICQGIGCSLMNVSATLFVVKPLPIEERGKGFGISIAAVYIGLTLAPMISGFLTYNEGWPSIFYMGIPLFITVLLILVFLIKKDWAIDEDTFFDLKGTIIYAVGMILFIYGFTILNQFIGIICALVGLVFIIYFVLYERKVDNPIFKVTLFRELEFSVATFASLISYIATFVITFVLNYHFQYIIGYDSQFAGLLLVTTPIIQAIISPISGRFSDKMNSLKLAAIGLVFVSIALGVLCTLNEQTPFFIIFIAMVLQGIGWGLFSSPNVNAIMSSVPPKDTNYASSAVSTVRTLGQTLSLGLFTMIFAIIMGNVAIVPSNYPLLVLSSQIACLISISLCILALIACIIGFKKGKILNS